MPAEETFVRVRYKDTDQMGVAYYANYFIWFEVGRTEYFRQKGITYREIEKKGIFLPVMTASCTYKKPSRYDEQLRIVTKVQDFRATRIAFYYEIFKENQLLAHGLTEHVFVNQKGRPVSLKSFSPELWGKLNDCL